MTIDKIEWIDKDAEEAIVTVGREYEIIECYSCPCGYNVGEKLTEPLECLDTKSVIVCDENDRITKIANTFDYMLQGKIINMKYGLVKVYGFVIHIDESEIPGDIEEGMYIKFETSRVDIW